MSARRRLTAAHLLVLPALLLIGLLLVLPYLNIVVMSLRVPSTSAPYAPGFTLDNFGRAVTDPFYLGILAHSLLLGLAVSLICLVAGLPVAYHLARTPSRWRGLLYGLVLSPLLIGVVIRCYGWVIVLANNGLINASLRAAGWIEGTVPLMYNEFGVTVGLVHVFLPFMILPLITAFQSIDPALEEAGRSLGGSRRRVLARIVLPLAMPGIQSGAILVFVLTISSFVTPAILGGHRVQLMAPLIVQTLIDSFLWPVGAALALVLAAAGALVLWLGTRLTERAMRRLA